MTTMPTRTTTKSVCQRPPLPMGSRPRLRRPSVPGERRGRHPSRSESWPSSRGRALAGPRAPFPAGRGRGRSSASPRAISSPATRPCDWPAAPRGHTARPPHLHAPRPRPRHASSHLRRPPVAPRWPRRRRSRGGCGVAKGNPMSPLLLLARCQQGGFLVCSKAAPRQTWTNHVAKATRLRRSYRRLQRPR